jgi:hypothetical protein
MRGHIRAIGEPVVPLNDKYPLAITFITAWRTQPDGTSALQPIGTGFILHVPTRFDGVYFEYVVTASHVVEGEPETFARIRTRDGGTKDLPAHDWVHHPHADVAIAPFIAAGETDLHLLHIPSASLSWRGVPGLAPELGDRIYFLGLLSLGDATRSLIARNVPMVRSGTIGAMYQDDIPLEWPDGSVRYMQAHLIDCRSYGGFSGAPCFFQRDDQPTGVKEGVPIRGTHTFLFGLVSGHFDFYKSAKLRGSIVGTGEVHAPINTGVGIVTPAERIVEVLEMDELSDERERVESERRNRKEEGATLDNLDPESEFERFEDLARKLVNTPKPEKDESQ